MFPTRHRETVADDVGKGTNVFVPGLMGAGVLLSVGVLIADVVQRVNGDRGRRRQVELVAGYIAEDVLRSIHRHQVVDPARGLRSRPTYTAVAIAFLALGVYGLIGSFWNYINPVDDGWVEDIAWVWAASLVTAASLLATGTVLAHITWRYPTVPVWARLFLARTPIGSARDLQSSLPVAAAFRRKTTDQS